LSNGGEEFFGLTISSIKGIAFDLAVKNGFVLSFSVKQGRADWK
jgi:hypothetical protein